MKIYRTILAFAVLVAFTLAVPSIAYAYLQDEIQVYDDEINAKGEYSLELHLNTTPRGNQQQNYPGEIVNNNNTRVTPELAYGLGHDLEAGFYLSYSNNDNSFNYAGVKARLKWLPYQEEKGDSFFAGVNFEVANTPYPYEPSRYNGEMRFIVGKHIDEWLVSFNPIFDQALSQPQAHQGPIFATATRVSRKVTPEWALGSELYTNLNQMNQPIVYPNMNNVVYAMMYFDGKPIAFQAGIGKGISHNADQTTLKAILSIPLP